MRSLRSLGLTVLVMLAAMPLALSARWVDLGTVASDGPPEVTLLRSGTGGASIAIEVPGLTVEDVETDLGPFARISIAGAGVTTDIGSPLLPVIREHIEIPQGAVPRLRIVSADYTEVRLTDLGIFARLYPAQPPVPKVPGALESAKLVIDDAAYSARGFSPGVAASLGEVGQVRAHRFVELNVYPVQYDPAAGTARYLKSIEVAVDFEGADWAATDAALARYASPDFDKFASRNLLNADTFRNRALLTLPIGYLIIVHDAFYEEIEMLAGLRHRLGYETTVTKTSQIPGGVTTAAIKTYIQNAYDTWAVPPTFILLVGDTPQVPCFTGAASTSGSDLYYTTMGGTADWLPDIYIGRFSCQTEAQVTLMADKTAKYARFALSSGTDWLKKATFMASSDNYTVSEGTHNYVINTWLNPAGYTCNKRYSQTYSATIAQVIADINGGISQLTYSGHGDVNAWSDGPAMNAGQVAALTNVDKLPIVQSYSCLTGQLESACFGETWTLAANGTALFWGSSTYSYWTEDDVLEKGVYDAWFGDGYNWARGMFNQGLWDVYQYYSGGGRTKSYYEQYNLFGDPAFDTWTNPPEALVATYSSVFPVGGESFLRRCGGVRQGPGRERPGLSVHGRGTLRDGLHGRERGRRHHGLHAPDDRRLDGCLDQQARLRAPLRERGRDRARDVHDRAFVGRDQRVDGGCGDGVGQRGRAAPRRGGDDRRLGHRCGGGHDGRARRGAPDGGAALRRGPDGGGPRAWPELQLLHGRPSRDGRRVFHDGGHRGGRAADRSCGFTDAVLRG